MFIDVEGVPVRVPKAYERYPQEAKDLVDKVVGNLHSKTKNLTMVTVTRVEAANHPQRRVIFEYTTSRTR